MPNPSQLAEDIAALETTVEQNTSGLASNTADIAAMKTAIEALKTTAPAPQPAPDMTDIEQRIAALETSFATLPNTPDALVVALTNALSRLTININVAGGTGTGTGGTGTGTGTGTGSSGVAFTGQSVGSSSDTNAYPFAMPDGIAGNAAVVLGDGPNTFEIILANSPGETPSISFDVILVRPDGTEKGIAGPLTSTSFDGEGGTGQAFKFKGPWGDNPKFLIAPGEGGSGTNGMFTHAASIDLAPMGFYGALNSRGGDAGGGDHTYISNDGTATVMLTINQPPATGTAGAPAVAATPISGASINGLPAAALTLDVLLANVPAGGTLKLPAGRFIGAGIVPNQIRVEGAGMGNTIIDATGFPLPQNKSVFLLGADGCYFKDFTVIGGRISGALGANGAAFRQVGAGISYTKENIETYNCQDGDLTFAGNYTDINCHSHDNGEPGSLRTHNVYIGGDKDSVVNVTGGLYEKPTDVHAFKTRAFTNNFKGTTFVKGDQGACVDIPDGGNTLLDGCTFRCPPGMTNLNMLAFGMENTQAYTSFVCTVNDATWDDILGTGLIQAAGSTPNVPMTLNITGTCTYNGPNPPEVRGFATVNGAFQKAA